MESHGRQSIQSKVCVCLAPVPEKQHPKQREKWPVLYVCRGCAKHIWVFREPRIQNIGKPSIVLERRFVFQWKPTTNNPVSVSGIRQVLSRHRGPAIHNERSFSIVTVEPPDDFLVHVQIDRIVGIFATRINI